MYIKFAFSIFLLVAGAASYNIISDHDAMMYLNRFGYVNDEDMADKMDMTMSDAKPMLMEFQKMCNINQTGVLDSKTMEMMNAPRCGNLDINQTEHHLMFMGEHRENEILADRFRRFTINENKYKWEKRELTYRMGMFSNAMKSHVTQDDVLKQLHKAFKLWSDVTNLDFIYAPNNKHVDIEISFTMRFHVQDKFPFDGPGKTLAHAFPPGGGVLGDVHFEDEENWTVDSPSGTNVLFVAVHEIGHALGLFHSEVRGAIMQPFYPGFKPKLKLHEDDILGVQSLYGKREHRTQNPSTEKATPKPRPLSTTTTTRRPPPRAHHKTTRRPSLPPTPTKRPLFQETTSIPDFMRPDLCKDPKVDAITALKDGSVYAFKGDYVFLIDGKGKGIIPGWPHRVETVFKGLDGNLDAAVTRYNGKTYFFKGQYYWRFIGTKLDPGYPRKISVHFPGIPDNIDSAFEWLGALYFNKGDKIWRFDPSTKPHVSDKYPISLRVWGFGDYVPRIDASFKASNDHIYFFYDSTYWRFDEKNFKVEKKLNPPYPRSSRVMWFGCTGGAPVDFRNIRQPEPFISNQRDFYEYDYY